MNLSIDKKLKEVILELIKQNNNYSITTFDKFLEDWLEIHKLQIEQNTLSGYEYILKKHILPYFKPLNLKLNELTANILNKYYSNKIDEGLSVNSILKHHANIRKALDYAYKNNMIIENIADKVELPKKTKYVADFYSLKETKQLIAHIPTKHRLYTPVLIASLLGLRRSEILGLKWDCVNFEKNTITIKRKNIFIQNKKQSITVNKLKNNASFRQLGIPDLLYRHLKNIRKYQLTNLSKSKFIDYVCLDEKGELIKHNYLTSYFPKYLIRNNFRRIRFHDLRHSCASMLLELNYSLKEIQEWLGHSDYSTTANIYTHIKKDKKQEMAIELNNAIII